MSDIEKLTELVNKFRDERDWRQFHNPKDLAIGLSIEASEFLEHFLWMKREELTDRTEERREELSDELADVFYYTLMIAHDLDIDLAEALRKKIKKTEKKYPVNKAKGNRKKYTEL
jgi:NTP pyrophosphatase (non-canonical NTP hydrolase)